MKYIVSFLLFFPFLVFAQENRFAVLEQKFNELSSVNPGLNEKVDFSVSGVSIQEFLRGLAESNNLNVSIDPNLNFRIYNNFTNEKVSNILLFLAREYELDISFVGSIMSFRKFVKPSQVVLYTPKDIGVKYNTYKDELSLDLQRDTLENVVKKITRTSRKNVIFAAGLADKIVNVYIEDLPFEKALEKFTLVNGLKLIKTDDNVYFIQKRNELEEADISKVNTQPNSGSRNSQKQKIKGRDGISISVMDTLGNKFVSLTAFNLPIADIIQSVSEELGVNYFMYSSIQGNTTINFSKLLYSDFLTHVLKGTNYTYKVDHDIYLIGDRKLEGLRANRVFQFKFRSLDAIIDIIPAELKAGVEIKEFKELNSILLSGSLPQINEIELYIKELDRVVPLVLIEVILIDVRKGKTVSTGIRAGLSDSVTTTSGTLLPGIDFTLSSKSINDFLTRIGGNAVNIGKVTPNFYMGLSALEENSNVEVRSMPKLSTLNGHEASLSIGSKRYYSIKTQNVLGSLNPQTVVTEQFQSVEANLGINIKPVVSGDDQVTLNIDVNISDFLGEPTTNAPPPTSTSQFKSIIRVRNEEMIVLGGIERNEKSESGSGVPLLSRIPVIKWLFSSRTKSRNKTVSVVFIKPTIIY
ncbi:type II secretion system protein GspD [Ohtaekwangia kribbensis]|uniref:Type II secretion system protein GspD n=1 Tax=Ohtaekwangia kribbensis TaxID=688913 RepID=A0ABW3K4Y0_9BACT